MKTEQAIVHSSLAWRDAVLTVAGVTESSAVRKPTVSVKEPPLLQQIDVKLLEIQFKIEFQVEIVTTHSTPHDGAVQRTVNAVIRTWNVPSKTSLF